MMYVASQILIWLVIATLFGFCLGAARGDPCHHHDRGQGGQGGKNRGQRRAGFSLSYETVLQNDGNFTPSW